MNNYIKTVICSALIIFISPSFINSCQFAFHEAHVTNPCIKLQNKIGNRVISQHYIVFCLNMSFYQDRFGRIIPRPCPKIGKYTIYDDSIFDNDEDDAGPVFWYFCDSGLYTINRIYPYFSNNGYTCDRPGYSCQKPQREVAQEKHEGFSPDTIVYTLSGEKRISEVESGDSVICYDFANQVWTTSIVIEAIKKARVSQLVKFKINDTWIYAEPEQMFYVKDSESWVFARDLKVNQHLFKRLFFNENNQFVISPIKEVVLEAQSYHDLVTLTLEDHHNFCINESLLAHNYTHIVASVASEFANMALSALASCIVKPKTFSSELEPEELIVQLLAQPLINTHVKESSIPSTSTQANVSVATVSAYEPTKKPKRSRVSSEKLRMSLMQSGRSCKFTDIPIRSVNSRQAEYLQSFWNNYVDQYKYYFAREEELLREYIQKEVLAEADDWERKVQDAYLKSREKGKAEEFIEFNGSDNKNNQDSHSKDSGNNRGANNQEDPEDDKDPFSHIGKKNTKFEFGQFENNEEHSIRHFVEELNLDVHTVKSAIYNNISKIADLMEPRDIYVGRVVVEGRTLLYVAKYVTGASKGNFINIGRITGNVMKRKWLIDVITKVK